MVGVIPPPHWKMVNTDLPKSGVGGARPPPPMPQLGPTVLSYKTKTGFTRYLNSHLYTYLLEIVLNYALTSKDA